MKDVNFCLAFLIMISGFCVADVTKLSAPDRKILQDTTRFREVHSTRDVPPGVVALCTGEGHEMADPGQKWNATDSIIDPTLPGKRLIWAGLGDGYYVIHYERGGIAHSYHILVARLTNDAAKPKLLWSAMGGPFDNYAGFVAALRTGNLDDRLD